MTEPGNADVRAIWERKAGFWDDYVGPEGNQWHRELIAPAQIELLGLQAGERVLELACGNGQFAREMASHGAEVVATDFSEAFLERARGHTGADVSVAYQRLDITQEAELRAMGAEPFDAVVCTMALMDVADIGPLAGALPGLLKPGGRFVFSVMHPFFNTGDETMITEVSDGPEGLRREHGLKLRRYLDIPAQRGTGIEGEPETHYYFHRPLDELLGTFLAQGMVLDGLLERAFPEADPPLTEVNWRALHQFPPALICRMRPAG